MRSVQTGRRCHAPSCVNDGRWLVQTRPSLPHPRASMTATLKRVRLDARWEDAVMAIVVRKNPSAARVTDADARALQEKISGMAIEWVPIDSIKSNPRNAKEHPEHQIALLAENIREFGFNHPILIDETNTNRGGHARIAAARRLGLKQVPVIRLNNLSPQEKRAVALADNKLAELGRWNPEMLRLELKESTIDTGELSFDPAIHRFRYGRDPMRF